MDQLIAMLIRTQADMSIEEDRFEFRAWISNYIPTNYTPVTVYSNRKLSYSMCNF